MLRQNMPVKVWIAAIPKYWNKEMPTNYPTNTSSKFSINFDTAEVKEAVKTMEKELEGEKSIITEDILPEHTVVGDYLGTYNVTGEPGELTLLSPEAVPADAAGVVAMHYVNESWTKVEDAQIIDGYAYGTLESFSPIAVFVIKRDSFLDESHKFSAEHNVFVANGLAVEIFLNEEGKIIAKDANGKETELTEDTEVIAGTIDGTDVTETSLKIGKGVKLANIVGGSCSENSVTTIKKIYIEIDGAEITKNILGSALNNRAERVSIVVRDTKAASLSAGRSNWTGKFDSNADFAENLGFEANAWVRSATIIAENCEISVVYGAGASGLYFTGYSEMTIRDSKIEYLAPGGSNGKTDSCRLTVENSEISKNFTTVNRGLIGSAKVSMNNCIVEKYTVLADPTDTTVNGGVISNVRHDIIAGEIKEFYVGNNGGEKLEDIEAVKPFVEYVKIGKTTIVNYMENADVILGELLIK